MCFWRERRRLFTLGETQLFKRRLFSLEFKVCPFFCHRLQQLTLLLDKVSPKILRHYFHFRPEIK